MPPYGPKCPNGSGTVDRSNLGAAAVAGMGPYPWIGGAIWQDASRRLLSLPNPRIQLALRCVFRNPRCQREPLAQASYDPKNDNEIQAYCCRNPVDRHRVRSRLKPAGPPAMEPSRPADGQPALGNG